MQNKEGVFVFVVSLSLEYSTLNSTTCLWYSTAAAVLCCPAVVVAVVVYVELALTLTLFDAIHKGCVVSMVSMCRSFGEMDIIKKIDGYMHRYPPTSETYVYHYVPRYWDRLCIYARSKRFLYFGT